MDLLTSFSVRCVVVFLLSSAFRGAVDNSPRRHTIIPTWRVDLRSVLEGEPVRLIVGSQKEPEARSQQSVWFIDDHLAVATFVTRKNVRKPKVSSRDHKDENLPMRLQAVLLDVNNRKILKTTNWPTQSRGSRIVVVHDGKFITMEGNDLTLYTSDFEVIKRTTLPPSGLIGWLPHPSPSGKSIVFSSAEMRPSSWLWVETDSLRIVSAWEDNPSGYLSISDKNMVTSTCWRGYECKNVIVTANEASACFAGPKCSSSVEVRTLSSDWKNISAGEPHLRPHFVNDELIFLPGSEGKLVRIDGTIVFSHPRPESWGCWGTGVLPSANGERFIIPNCHLQGAVTRLDISGHGVLKQVEVFDTDNPIRVQTLDVGGPKLEDQMAFAVSPDGSKLAILNDESVEILPLP